MSRNRMLWVSLAVVAVMAAVAGATLLWGPHHDALPVHWNAAGEVDRTERPWFALMVMPACALFVTVVMAAIRHIEPQRDSLEKSAGLYYAAWAGVLIVLAAADVMVLSAAWGWHLTGVRLIVGAVGLLFVLLGNQLGKSRRMYLVGIRTPWTLANEDVWIATHRLGGKLMVAAGLLCVAVAALGIAPERSINIMMAAVIAAALIPVVYSYFAWRRVTRAQ